MEEIMNGIVVPGKTPEASVQAERLAHYTNRIPVPYVKKINWTKVEHLYIFGTAVDQNRQGGEDCLEPGAYVDVFGKWVLVVGVADQDIQKLLSRCSSGLEKLMIRFSGVQELNVRRLTGLRALLLERNRKLNQLWGLEQLRGLRKLNVTWSALTELILPQPLPELRHLDAHNSRLTSCDFLRRCPELRLVNLSGTAITRLPDLRNLAKLRVLNLECSKLADLGTAPLPTNLVVLNLHKTQVRRLSDEIRKLRRLKILDLSNLELTELPRWLPELGLEFNRGDGEGIRLKDTTIRGVDMSIFDQNREMILQWFEQRRMTDRWSVFLGYNSGSNRSYSADFLRSAMKLWDTDSFLCLDENRLKLSGRYDVGENNFFDSNLLQFIQNPEREKNRIWVKSFEKPPFAISPREVAEWLKRPLYPRGPSPRWLCGRYTPPEGFDAEGWSLEKCRRAWELGEPLFFPDGKPEEMPETGRPLNELKIVFLGDGEAGKTHTIARLLRDGKQVENFKSLSTPGIVIEDKNYSIGGRKIQVHFWDFGGQEILHSMHRMFLTEKTLYVVMLNVREGNQDERARYWLHNLSSFAGGAPALLVLNKMDMNKNASVNEKDLRAMYPSLTRIVKISTLKDSDETFCRNFVDVLKGQIGSFEYLESPFLPSWSRLKLRLQKMEDNYIRGKEYRRLCDECGVKGSDDVRTGLLKWFSNLGVSFCYSGSAKLEDYVVLRPDWITNAVYMILFNKIDEVKNGLVSHEVIHRMLQSTDTDKVRRTVEDAAYSVEEVAYVLNVFRRFRLSFLVDSQTEFMPMLCDANSTDAAEIYERDPDALEFRMHYAYLPNNVIHCLMVERSKELDIQNVWLTGARFVWGNTGLSAVVKGEGNLLRIMVRADNRNFKAYMYLDELKSDLERINAEMGLKVSRMEVAYKKEDTVEYFSYRMLMNSLKANLKFVASEHSDEAIPVDDILKQSDRPADERRTKLLRDLTLCCELLQDNQNYWNLKEDDRTTYIRDLLVVKGYIVLDQHRGGISAGGKQAGELDLDIRLEPDAQWTIFEALNLEGDSPSEMRYWDKHLDKLLDQYNTAGRPYLFHVSYVECKKEKFHENCRNYEKHIRSYSPEGFRILPERVRQLPPVDENYRRNQFLQVIESTYDCGGARMTVYNFFLRIGKR